MSTNPRKLVSIHARRIEVLGHPFSPGELPEAVIIRDDGKGERQIRARVSWEELKDWIDGLPEAAVDKSGPFWIAAVPVMLPVLREEFATQLRDGTILAASSAFEIRDLWIELAAKIPAFAAWS